MNENTQRNIPPSRTARVHNVYHLRTVKTTETINENGQTKQVTRGGIPYATIALEINPDGTVNRGLSICSMNDPFDKHKGAIKANGRMEAAILKQTNVLPIQGGIRHMEKRIAKRTGTPVRVHMDFSHFGFYHVEPTAWEKEMFRSDFALIANQNGSSN